MKPFMAVFFYFLAVAMLATDCVEMEQRPLKSAPKPFYYPKGGKKQSKLEIIQGLRASRSRSNSEQVHIRPKKSVNNILDLVSGEQVHGKTPAKARIERAPKKDRIPGEYIVVLKDSYGKDSVHNLAASLSSRRRNINVKSTFTKVLKGFSIEIQDDDQALLDRIRSFKEVSYVAENGKIYASEVPWGLDRIDQRDLPLDNSFLPGGDGSGVKIFVLDTGIRPSHMEFGNRANYFMDVIDGTKPDDPNGHGTHVAGTAAGAMYGVAKGATVEALRVLDASGSGSYSGIITALNEVASQNNYPKGIVSMSLGGGFSSAVNDAVASLRSNGFFVAVAAGNDNTDACSSSPASVPSAITVGSSTTNDERSSFSNFGSCLDIFAPGSSIISAWPSSDTATAILSGTSMATPFVSGVAAVIWGRDPSLTITELENEIVNMASLNKLSNPGSGSPNKLLFLSQQNGQEPPPPGTQPPPSGDKICFDDCPNWAVDGYCDDGGDGSVTDWCAYGHDCTDCGERDPAGC